MSGRSRFPSWWRDLCVAYPEMAQHLSLSVNPIVFADRFLSWRFNNGGAEMSIMRDDVLVVLQYVRDDLAANAVWWPLEVQCDTLAWLRKMQDIYGFNSEEKAVVMETIAIVQRAIMQPEMSKPEKDYGRLAERIMRAS